MDGEKDLRKTKQRRHLLSVFKSAEKAMTADQILRHCHIECPNMALTTVYRNLDKLIEMGYVQKTIHPDGAARFTSAQKSHRHMVTCRICHAQVELKTCPITMSEEWISRETGFRVEHHYLEYFGLCPQCLKKDLAFKRQKVELPGITQDSSSEDEECEPDQVYRDDEDDDFLK